MTLPDTPLQSSIVRYRQVCDLARLRQSVRVVSCSDKMGGCEAGGWVAVNS